MVALHVAAQGKVPQTATPELKRLAKDPQIIKQLDSYPATTARLALAARTQLADCGVRLISCEQNSQPTSIQSRTQKLRVMTQLQLQPTPRMDGTGSCSAAGSS